MIELLQTSPMVWVAVVFIYALLIGSFLNVVILRLPARMEFDWRVQASEVLDQSPPEQSRPGSLVVSRSACPKCHQKLRWFHNIPLISYLALKGKCAHCENPISIQYPAVELFTAVASAVVAWKFGFQWAVVPALILTWTLIALSGIDIRKQLLPDSMTYPLLWLGLLLSTQNLFTNPIDSIVGATVGYLSLWSVYHLFRLTTGKEGMGYGDFKLLAAFGAWLGWQAIPLVIILSSLVGAVVGIAMIVISGRDKSVPMPFGPFIAAAGWIALLWGQQLTNLYFEFSGIN